MYRGLRFPVAVVANGDKWHGASDNVETRPEGPTIYKLLLLEGVSAQQLHKHLSAPLDISRLHVNYSLLLVGF